MEVKKVNRGFGLGSNYTPNAVSPHFNQPSVPEPWMGTYGEKLPVIPSENCGCVLWCREVTQRTMRACTRKAIFRDAWRLFSKRKSQFLVMPHDNHACVQLQSRVEQGHEAGAVTDTDCTGEE
jgi:hypothetical protein